jgi:hypothetical protein
MDPLTAVMHSIDQLLQQAVNDGLLDDQFLQLMQLQVSKTCLAVGADRFSQSCLQTGILWRKKENGLLESIRASARRLCSSESNACTGLPAEHCIPYAPAADRCYPCTSVTG